MLSLVSDIVVFSGYGPGAFEGTIVPTRCTQRLYTNCQLDIRARKAAAKRCLEECLPIWMTVKRKIKEGHFASACNTWLLSRRLSATAARVIFQTEPMGRQVVQRGWPGHQSRRLSTTENVPPETQSYDHKKTSYRLTGSRPSATRTLRGFAFISPEAMRAPGAHKSEGARQS